MAVYLDGERVGARVFQVTLDGVDISKDTFDVDRRGLKTVVRRYALDQDGSAFVAASGGALRKLPELVVDHGRVRVEEVM